MAEERLIWAFNDHGAWCPACGYLIADAAAELDPGHYWPFSCRQCGFPDFEDGPGYFTEEEPI